MEGGAVSPVSTKENSSSLRSENSMDFSPNAADTAALRHMKVAEAAVTGWEKATAESTALKVQLEQALQEKEVSDRKAARLDSALKESIRELRRVREEQTRRIQDAVEERIKEWEIQRTQLLDRISEQEKQLTEVQKEMDVMASVLEDRTLTIQDMEKQADSLRSLLKRAKGDKAELKQDLKLPEPVMFNGISSEETASFTSAAAVDLKNSGKISLDEVDTRESMSPSLEHEGAQKRKEEMVEVSRNVAVLAVFRHDDKDSTQEDKNDDESKRQLRQEHAIKVEAEGVVVKESTAKEANTGTCQSCKELKICLFAAEMELKDECNRRKQCEEAVALLEGELVKLSSRLSETENKSVSSCQKGYPKKEEVTLAEEENSKLATGEIQIPAVENQSHGSLEKCAMQDLEAVSTSLPEAKAIIPAEQSDYNELTNALATANHQIARLSQDLAESKQETVDVDNDLAAVEEMVAQLSEGLEERENLRVELAAAHEKVDELSKELADWRRQTSGLQEELASAQEAISSLSKELDGKDDMERELTASKETVAELSNELAQWRNDTAKLGAELAWAQNRVAELVHAGNDTDAKLAEFDNMLLSAEADKESLNQELKLSQDALAKAMLRLQGLDHELALYEAEVRALRDGDFEKAQEFHASRLERNQSQETREGKHSNFNSLNSALWQLNEMKSFRDEVDADLEAAAQWTVELESRLEDERQSKEQLQAELGRQRSESTTLNAMLAAATERASVLESRLAEAETRVGDVRRNLFAMHKEKLAADMDLALANAAKTELGARLDMANNEVCALVAKLNALVDDSNLDRERREAVKTWLLQEGLDSVGGETMTGRESSMMLPSLSYSRPPVRRNLPEPMYSPAENGTAHSPLFATFGEDRMDRASPLPPRRPNRENAPRSSGSRRTATGNGKVNAYYSTPHSRRTRSRGHPPVTLGDNSGDDRGGLLSESMAEDERVGAKRVVSPLSVDLQMDAYDDIVGNGSPHHWQENLMRRGFLSSPASSQETMSPATTPSTVLPPPNGGSFFGSARHSTKAGVFQKQAEFGVPNLNFGRAFPAEFHDSARFLGRSKRSRADGVRE